MDIKLVITAGSGCGDSITKTVLVWPKPLSWFSIDSFACAADSVAPVNMSFSGTGASYEWSVSSSAVSISSANAITPYFRFPDNQSGTDSTYTIQLIITTDDGCRDTSSESITVRSRPVAGFSLPATSCAPLSISPTDTSTGNSLAYSWSVSPLTGVTLTGSGTSNPQFSFVSPTSDTVNYTITLNITDVNGCTDSAQRTFTVYPKPTASFTSSIQDSCGPVTVSFNNTSSPNITGQNTGNLSYRWDFGNNDTSSNIHTNRTYTNTGIIDSTYYITLIATNSLGCSDTITDSIVIHPDPLAVMNFSSFTDCAPYLIDTSVVSASLFPNTNSSYTWNVYDTQGNLLNQYNGPDAINHTLNNGGDSVYIQLITQSLYGCANDSSTRQLFYTIVNPTANFTALPDTGCSPLNLSLQNNSSSGVSSEWFLNGTSFSTQASPQLTLTNLSQTSDSVVSIKLIITAGSGCLDSITKDVVIQPQPIAQFSINPTACALDSLPTSNSSISSGGLSYQWSASSPLVQIINPTDSQPTIVFPDNQSGTDSTYTIQLVVSSSAGCTDTSTQNVIVYSRPLAGFTLPAAACAPISITPTNTTTGNFLNYQWSVSPTTGVTLTNATNTNPQLDFTVPAADSAVYSITLTVTNINGCIDSISQDYSVYPLPSASFAPSNTDSCGPLTVNFNNTSASNINGQGLGTMSFIWDLGNGTNSTATHPSATYINNGVNDSVYIVQLIASNSLGCSDTITDTITVRPNPLAQIDSLVTLSCAPFLIDSTIAKAIVYPNANSTYLWQVIDPLSGAIIQTFNGANGLNYNMIRDDDSLWVNLITSGTYGCINDTARITFHTYADSRPGFIVSDSTGCHPHTITITDTSASSASHQWFINGALSSTLASPTFTLTNTSLTMDSVYEIKLVSTVGNTGCDDSVSKFVTVYALPDPSFVATEVCLSNNTSFTGSFNTIDNIIQFHWDFGDGQTDTLQNTTHLYASSGTYYVQFTVTDSRGCSQTFGDSVIVRPNPVADFVANGSCGPDTLCPGQSFNLNDLSGIATLGGSLTNWSWDILDDGSIEYTTQNPQHTFNQPGTYDIKLWVETQYGCPDSIVRQVFVQDSLNALFVTDTNSNCGPLDIVATDMSNGLIETWQWELYSLDPQ